MDCVSVARGYCGSRSWKGYFPGRSDGKASACKAGDLGSIPEPGRSPREGNGNPLQYPCLENSMDGGGWWATVHGIPKSRTRLSDFTGSWRPSGQCHIGRISSHSSHHRLPSSVYLSCSTPVSVPPQESALLTPRECLRTERLHLWPSPLSLSPPQRSCPSLLLSEVVFYPRFSLPV